MERGELHKVVMISKKKTGETNSGKLIYPLKCRNWYGRFFAVQDSGFKETGGGKSKSERKKEKREKKQ
jgi:hypothetical protein